jgi:hypothetical protein
MLVWVAAAGVLQDMVEAAHPCCRLLRLTLSTRNKRFLFRMARMKSFRRSFVVVERHLWLGSVLRLGSDVLRIAGSSEFFSCRGLLDCGRMGRYLLCAPLVHDAPHAGPRLREHSLRSRGDITPRSNTTLQQHPPRDSPLW